MPLRLASRWALVLAALGWTAYQLPPLVRSANAGRGVLHELRWPWVAAAALLGVAAVALYGELHRQLLVVGGARPASAVVQSISFAQNAIGNTVPVVGGAGALAYAVAGLRRRGIDGALAAWAVFAAGVLSVLCLVALGAGALTAAGRLPLAGGALVVTGMLVVGAGGVLLARHPGALRGGAARLLPVRPSPRQWLVLLCAAVVPWLADVATLAAAAAAVPGSVPWPALVWGFLVVQGSIALQVLPGGAGLAEVGLLGVLMGSGVAPGPAAGVVLVYRVCSWLLPSALGWLVYGAQLRRGPGSIGVHEVGWREAEDAVVPCVADPLTVPFPATVHRQIPWWAGGVPQPTAVGDGGAVPPCGASPVISRTMSVRSTGDGSPQLGS